MNDLTLVQDTDARIKELADQLIVARCVIAYYRGGLPLAANVLTMEDRRDLLPYVKQAIEAERKAMFSQ